MSTQEVNLEEWQLAKLKEKGQINISDFTPERVASITHEIYKTDSEGKSKYIPGKGISATKLAHLFYSYQQDYKTFEGIAYYLFSLVATRPEGQTKGKNLYFVRENEVGQTKYPPVPSAWHDWSSRLQAKNAIDKALGDLNCGLSFSSKTGMITSIENDSLSTNETLAMLFDNLSQISSQLACVFRNK